MLALFDPFTNTSQMLNVVSYVIERMEKMRHSEEDLDDATDAEERITAEIIVCSPVSSLRVSRNENTQ